MTSETLKSCPFCGGEAETCHVTQLWEPRNSYWVKCKNCRINGVHHTTEAEAIAAWNARAERTCNIEHAKSGAMYDVWRCSACGYEYAESVSETSIVQNFCPNCGARVVE